MTERAGAALLFAAAVTVVVAVSVIRTWSDRSIRFLASSAYDGYGAEGHLTDPAAYGLLFHTRSEREPWVELDLGEARGVRSIDIQNRTDCCADRAVPL